MARIRHETQIHILNLLITSLELKAPNLALYLLGYEVKKPVSSTNLQDPGESLVFTLNMFILVAVMMFNTVWTFYALSGKKIGWFKCVCLTGVLGCPRSCLHAILSRLQRGTEKRSGPALTQQAPHLAELCYQVIFKWGTISAVRDVSQLAGGFYVTEYF